ncbi:MAG: hypothetical protein M3N68_12265, partial [Actinomycetota bacterium]|nr:hypothetical protein [Actinomycetota bacterium]
MAPLLDRCPGALCGAIDRPGRGVEHRRDLGGCEPEHLTQKQHRALVAPQVLKRRNGKANSTLSRGRFADAGSDSSSEGRSSGHGSSQT